MPTVTDSEFWPIVSILTPSFNQAAWLPDVLESVGRQTYANIEHIVVDGASTDETVDILRRSPYSPTWVSEPDDGQSAALNKALSMSSGEVIGWLNSDDAYLFTDVVEDVVNHFARAPSVDVVYGHAALTSARGKLLQVIWVPPFDADLLGRFNYITQPSVFIRRRAIKSRLADETFHYCMDRELWLRLARSASFSRLDRILAIDRHQMSRKSYTRPDLADAERRRLTERYALSPPNIVPLERRLRKILYRLRGVSLVPRLDEGERAFPWFIDSRAGLLARQILVKRSLMAE